MAPMRKKKCCGAKNKTAIVKTSKAATQPARDTYENVERVLLQQCNSNVPASNPTAQLPGSRRASSPKSDDSRTAAKAAKSFTAEHLMEKAEEYIDTFEFALAEKFCARAIEMDPRNSAAHSLRGSALTELGKLEEAREAFRRAIEINPECDYAAHLSYGQLSEGEESRASYEKAISLLKVQMDLISSKSGKGTLGAENAEPDFMGRMRKDLCSTYCAIAELYMTDLCFDPDAEKQCLKNMKAAMAVDDRNPEAYQSMASFYLVKNDTTRATAFLKQSLGCWLDSYKAATGDGDGKAEKGGDFDPVVTCPLSYSARVGCVKLCIELDMFQEARDVLDGLIAEDDEDEETWYLLGYVNYLQGEENWISARFFFLRAREVMQKNDVNDETMQSSLEELLNEIRINPKVPHTDDEEDSDEESVAKALNLLEIYSSGDEDEDDSDGDNEDEDEAMTSDKDSGTGDH